MKIKAIIFAAMTVMALSVNAAVTYTKQSVLSSGRWVKISVADQGVYQLSPSDLKGMGFNNPAKVRLFGMGLPMLPESDLPSLGDDVQEIPLFRRADGTALFYSPGTTKWTLDSNLLIYSSQNNPYSNKLYYLLTEGDSVAVLNVEKAEQEPAHSTSVVTSYAKYEKDAYSFMNAGCTFYDDYEFTAGHKKSYTLSLPDNCGSQVIVTAAFGVSGPQSSTNLIMSVGDKSTTVTFDRLGDETFAVNKSLYSSYENPGNTIKVNMLTESSGVISGHLDYIIASYARKLTLADKSFVHFHTPSDFNYKVTVEGANEATRVWKVTNPQLTCEQEGALSGSDYVANVINHGQDDFVAVNTNATFPVPDYVGEVANQNLHALRDVDYIIIVPANGILIRQAQRLADIHAEKDGLACAVVRADHIYNEFSGGTPDVTAYRRFLKMLYDTASSPEARPKNVLLFGTCYWDNRMCTAGLSKKSQDDCLLVYESKNSWSGTDSYMLEEYITLLDDDEGVAPLLEKPDMGVGRIPVDNVADATGIVDKIIAYINGENIGSWLNTICVIADDGDNNIHMSDAEYVAKNTKKLYPSFSYKKIYIDSFTRTVSATGSSYGAAEKEINHAISEGAAIVNYTGHGAPYCLSHEQILKTRDFQRWNSPRLPLWITAACDVTPLDMNKENIGYESLRNKNGGSIGFIGTTRAVYSSANRTINSYLMKRILEEGYTIGEALAMAKCDILSSRSITTMQSINKVHYVLTGDPALCISAPTNKIKVETVNGESDMAALPVMNAGSKASMAGHVYDAEGKPLSDFNGTISAVIYDSEETIICNDNAGSGTKFKYVDRPRVIYKGQANVVNGAFEISFPVPLDINYSNLAGQINLFAIANGDSARAQGYSNAFLVGGTDPEAVLEGEGPSVVAWLNHENFKSGDTVNETPCLFVAINDSDGINTTGNGLGHDITAIIDNKEYTSYSLNDYFTQDVGDYTSGKVRFSIPELSEGFHTIKVRAFDVFNHMGQTSFDFYVSPGLKPDIIDIGVNAPVTDVATFIVVNNRPETDIDVEISVFDPFGKLLYRDAANGQENSGAYKFDWNLTNTVGLLPTGVYIVRVTASNSGGEVTHKSRKFIVADPHKDSNK